MAGLRIQKVKSEDRKMMIKCLKVLLSSNVGILLALMLFGEKEWTIAYPQPAIPKIDMITAWSFQLSTNRAPKSMLKVKRWRPVATMKPASLSFSFLVSVE